MIAILTARANIREHCLDAPMHCSRLLVEPQTPVDLIDLILDRSLRQVKDAANRGVAQALRHERKHIILQPAEAGYPSVEQTLHQIGDPGIEHNETLCDS